MREGKGFLFVCFVFTCLGIAVGPEVSDHSPLIRVSEEFPPGEQGKPCRNHVLLVKLCDEKKFL